MVDELRLILLGIGLLIIGLIYAWGMRARIRERLQNRRREPGLGESDAVDSQPEPDVWSQPEVRVVQKTEPEQTPPQTPRNIGPTAKETAVAGMKPVPKDSTGTSPATKSDVTAKTSAGSPVPPGPPVPPTADKATASRQPSEQAQKPVTIGKVSEWNVLLTLMAPERQPYTGPAIKAAAEQQQLVLAERGVWECLTGDGSERMIFGVAHLREPGTFDPNRLATLRTPGLLLFMPLPGPIEAVPAVDLLIEQAGQLQRRLGGVLCDERRNRLTTSALLQLRARAEEFDEQLQSSSSPATP